jgi:phosphopantothenoylcysteine decarboxylase/phosphopantothenate--cysteine ligase
LINKKILIIGGATAESVDDIRILTNRSSGTTAIALALNAFERGAGVELWYGHGTEAVPSYLSCKRFTTVMDLLHMVKGIKAKSFDGIIVCAAIANYIPKKQKGKIPSGKDKLTIDSYPAPFILEHLRSRAPQSKIIAFNAEEEKTNVRRKTYQLLKKYSLDGAVGNTLAAFGTKDAEIFILTKKGKGTWKKGKKEELVSPILDMIK